LFEIYSSQEKVVREIEKETVYDIEEDVPNERKPIDATTDKVESLVGMGTMQQLLCLLGVLHSL
jgi:hypothetical protein